MNEKLIKEGEVRIVRDKLKQVRKEILFRSTFDP